MTETGRKKGHIGVEFLLKSHKFFYPHLISRLFFLVKLNDFKVERFKKKIVDETIKLTLEKYLYSM